MNKTTLTSLYRFTGYLEGGSLLLLVLIAMPIKYMLNNPNVVTVVGMMHGGLFTLYVITLFIMAFIVKVHLKWPIMSFVLAFVPFGTFILDRYFVRSNAYQNIIE
ncbi:DUF3817 domain-containing protein [Mammaliicoccus sp. Dog046]|uniref:DUF3817 domain-containing protein n=1 Tax=Mammaliicoccus sp. Dog046 TaxID=3034233 RepID=UPI002B261F0D|nr:DUF3817 domain-containing protein [Mammaliicoccus sp. Dog046]WQK85055.1 DUF3817 domain-containing protein [Mammaliicoccus sp. Dog046]